MNPLLVSVALLVGLGQTGSSESPWNFAELSRSPRVFPAEGFKAEGVQALFLEGLPYRGKPTRVFAWYGTPGRKNGEKLPAVVLVHGGGGTAFDEWVRVWNRHGYAAIALDLEGHVPPQASPQPPKRGQPLSGHAWSGPSRQGIFDDIEQPIEDQWMYHAVADVVLADSYLRSLPEIDPERIGLTGISWGGILASVVVGVDGRFKFAVPVYGCGFLMDADNHYARRYEAMTREEADRCRRLWDGSSYLGRAKMPILWVSGTNDQHFPLNILQRSYRAAAGPQTLCIRIGMRHGHQPGWAPEEIYAFADSLVRGGRPLVRITGQGSQGNRAWVGFDPRTPPVRAELNLTTDTSHWSQRRWITQPARIDPAAAKASAVVPAGATAWYFNLSDTRGLTVSSPHVSNAPGTASGSMVRLLERATLPFPASAEETLCTADAPRR